MGRREMTLGAIVTVILIVAGLVVVGYLLMAGIALFSFGSNK